MRIAVIGAGSWGTAVYRLLLMKGFDVILWARRHEIAELVKSGENAVYLPGVQIPKGKVTVDINEAVCDRDLVIFAVPTQYVRSVLRKIDGELKAVLNLAKGIEVETGKRLEEVFVEEKKPESYATLSGPSHAEEVARDVPTGVVVASKDETFAMHVQGILSTPSFRVYRSSDLIGVEIAGALKNIVAIACGILDGFGRWDNTKAALITRGLAEMARFGMRFGAKLETFVGLAGVGDLMVTCTSRHSRNRKLGELVGRGMRLEDVQKEMNMVAEGVPTTKAVWNIATKEGIYMPITEHVYKVLYEGVSPEDAMLSLMNRPLKREWG